jgi:hypothetical protein
MSFVRGGGEFAARGNVIKMAVGVIAGTDLRTIGNSICINGEAKCELKKQHIVNDRYRS